MDQPQHLTMDELVRHVDEIREAPRDDGELLLIVRRPDTDLREVLDEGTLDLVEGLVGDTWRAREQAYGRWKGAP
jgi:hypothetical protein